MVKVRAYGYVMDVPGGKKRLAYGPIQSMDVVAALGYIPAPVQRPSGGAGGGTTPTGGGGMAIGGAVSGGLPNLMPYIDAAGKLAQDTKLAYDGSTGKLSSTVVGGISGVITYTTWIGVGTNPGYCAGFFQSTGGGITRTAILAFNNGAGAYSAAQFSDGSATVSIFGGGAGAFTASDGTYTVELLAAFAASFVDSGSNHVTICDGTYAIYVTGLLTVGGASGNTLQFAGAASPPSGSGSTPPTADGWVLINVAGTDYKIPLWNV